MNGALVIWSSCVVPSRLPALQAVMIAAGQIGVAGGPLLGGALTGRVSWRWCKSFPSCNFFLNLLHKERAFELLLMSS
jgi:MFS family permease